MGSVLVLSLLGSVGSQRSSRRRQETVRAIRQPEPNHETMRALPDYHVTLFDRRSAYSCACTIISQQSERVCAHQ